MIYQVLEEPPILNEIKGEVDIPQSLEEFLAEIKKESVSDAKTFAVKLKAMVKYCYMLFQISINICTLFHDKVSPFG